MNSTNMNDVLNQFINKNSERAEEYNDLIEQMLSDYSSGYSYAEDTLVGILSYIEENRSITDAQVEAVENIRKKPSKGYGV